MSNNQHKIREMQEFFNSVSSGYDERIKEVIKNFDKYYALLANPMECTNVPIRILDLGCGTGAELKDILTKCPNAQITCIDIAEEMLKILEQKYINHLKQLSLVHASYERIELQDNYYDYAVCAMCLHHYPYERKLKFFKRVFNSLKKGGIFIEGDFIATPLQEKEDLEIYNRLLSEFNEIEYGDYNVDAPACIATEIKILTDAGFNKVDVLYKEENLGILLGCVD